MPINWHIRFDLTLLKTLLIQIHKMLPYAFKPLRADSSIQNSMAFMPIVRHITLESNGANAYNNLIINIKPTLIGARYCIDSHLLVYNLYNPLELAFIQYSSWLSLLKSFEIIRSDWLDRVKRETKNYLILFYFIRKRELFLTI